MQSSNHPKSSALKKLLNILMIFLLSMLSCIIVVYYLFPYLATVKYLNKFQIFKKGAENVVVINKTEQVKVSEEQTITTYTSKSLSSVVEIVGKKKAATASTSSVAGAVNPAATDTTLGKIGSGVIVTADGLVVTYADAVNQKDAEYQIIDSDGKTYGASVVLVDSFTNLALLKIPNVTNLPVASFINPTDIKAGAKVILIGKNGGNGESFFESGVISELARNYSVNGPIAASEKLQGVLLADFALGENQNESFVGGAVVDWNGDVIGILGVRKDQQTFRHFVISVGHVQDLINGYLAAGNISRGQLGVYYLPLSKESAFMGLNNSDHGALVYSASQQQGLAVIAGSPAEKAGVKIADVILAVNGEEVNLDTNLAYLISKKKPGDAITLKVLRQGAELDLTATLQ